MTKENLTPTASAPESSTKTIQRRSFLKGMGMTGAALSAAPLLATTAKASQNNGIITSGDVAILRFLAAAELIETDLWQTLPLTINMKPHEIIKRT